MWLEIPTYINYRYLLNDLAGSLKGAILEV
jgi:hypothetical protein